MPMFNGKFILASTLPVSNPLSISKDSVVLTTEAHSINFTGAGVSASSDPSGNVTVNIPGSSGSSLTVNSNAGIDTINFNTSRFTVLPDSPGTISIDATTSMISGVGGFSGSGVIFPPVPFSLLAFQIGFLLSEINPGEIIISIDNQPNQVWYNSTLLGEQNPLLGLKLNFTGAGVTVTPNAENSFNVDIPGGGGSAPDATTTSKGIVQLAGDLDGTADSPSVPGLANKINKTGDNVSGTYVYNGIPTAPLTLARTTITSNDARIYLESATSDSDKTLELTPSLLYATYNYSSGADYNYSDTTVSTTGIIYNYSYSIGGIAKSGTTTLSASESSIVVDGTPYLATQGKHIATKQYVDNTVSLKASLASPTFTGTPAAPTATAGTNTTQIATTAFVTSALALKANLTSPTFTGTPAAPTATAGTNTTQIATTAFVTTGLNTKISKTGDNVTGTYVFNFATTPSSFQSKNVSISQGSSFNALADKIVGTYIDEFGDTVNIIESYNSYHEADAIRILKTYSGNPASPIEMFDYTRLTSEYFNMSYMQTDSVGNTTDFNVLFDVSEFSLTKNGSPYIATNARDIATKQYVDNTVSLKANLASPTFTGTPAAPTAFAGTNTTQIATTAFVTTAVANSGSLPFIPANDFYSRRSLQPVISTNTLFSSGFGASSTTWSNSSGNITSTIPSSTGVRTKQIRVKLAASSTAGSSLSIGSLLPTPLGFLGGGFLFSFGFSTSSEATPNLTTKCFLGLCTGGPPTITANPSTLTNIIGIGNDSNNDGTIRDANLQIMYNDASGTATKVDLGANFPANGSGTQDWFVAQFYNAVGSSSVKYKITNLLNNATAEGTLTTNLPAITVGLGFAFVRTSGTTAIAHAIEFGEITWQSDG